MWTKCECVGGKQKRGQRCGFFQSNSQHLRSVQDTGLYQITENALLRIKTDRSYLAQSRCTDVFRVIPGIFCNLT